MWAWSKLPSSTPSIFIKKHRDSKEHRYQPHSQDYKIRELRFLKQNQSVNGLAHLFWALSIWEWVKVTFAPTLKRSSTSPKSATGKDGQSIVNTKKSYRCSMHQGLLLTSSLVHRSRLSPPTRPGYKAINTSDYCKWQTLETALNQAFHSRFVLQLWRKIETVLRDKIQNKIYLQSCKTKSTMESLGSRLRPRYAAIREGLVSCVIVVPWKMGASGSLLMATITCRVEWHLRWFIAPLHPLLL